jgi:3-oxoacyl-[acyl-carrier protein] reductase
MAAHRTSEAALNTFAQFVACEAGPLGVQVNVVAPGFVGTEASTGTPRAHVERLASRTPLGRVAEAEDVAEDVAKDVAKAITMLVSGDAGCVTGNIVRADGGLAASRR